METQHSANHKNLVPLTWAGMETVQKVQSNIEPDCPKSTEVSSENGREFVLRDASGKLLPGGPGLPGAGRPKGSGVVSDAIKQALRDGKADEVKDTLFELVDSADRDSVRLAAIAEIIDRSEGKAVQNIRHAGVFMVMAPGEDVLNAAFGGIAPSEDNE